MDGTFTNPILFADYSDPDVIRVGDQFILTASSFNYVPGLPLLTSRDLVNWKLEGYAVKEIAEDASLGIPHEDSAAIGKRFETPRPSEGIWAPSIRFHDGKYYIYYGMPDEGIYVTFAEDIHGPWHTQVCVRPAKGFIDPCPYWDEDGRAYIIHAYAKSRIGFKSMLGIFEISPDGLTAISEDAFLFDGNDPSHPALTIEGPKVYQRNGYYYILAPAGGVRQGWQVCLRSQNIHGPYELRTVMEQGDTVINGPHQGGLVDSPDGREWFLHFQDRGLYGRICHLQPVKWVDDWPVIGSDEDHDGIGNPVYEYPLPKCGEKRTALEVSDHFLQHKIGRQWQWLGNLRENPLAFTEQKDGLALRALNLSNEADPLVWHSSNVLTEKLVLPEFQMDFKLDASRLKPGNRAGILMMGGQYICMYVQKTYDQAFVKVRVSEGSDSDKREIETASFDITGSDLSCLTFRMIFVRESKAKVSEEGEVSLKTDAAADLYFCNCDAEKPQLRMFFQTEDRPFTDTGCRFTPSDHTWIGAKTGLYALAEQGAEEGTAAFHSVITTEL